MESLDRLDAGAAGKVRCRSRRLYAGRVRGKTALEHPRVRQGRCRNQDPAGRTAGSPLLGWSFHEFQRVASALGSITPSRRRAMRFSRKCSCEADRSERRDFRHLSTKAAASMVSIRTLRSRNAKVYHDQESGNASVETSNLAQRVLAVDVKRVKWRNLAKMSY